MVPITDFAPLFAAAIVYFCVMFVYNLRKPKSQRKAKSE